MYIEYRLVVMELEKVKFTFRYYVIQVLLLKTQFFIARTYANFRLSSKLFEGLVIVVILPWMTSDSLLEVVLLQV